MTGPVRYFVVASSSSSGQGWMNKQLSHLWKSNRLSAKAGQESRSARLLRDLKPMTTESIGLDVGSFKGGFLLKAAQQLGKTSLGISGKWKKQPLRSDSMDEACDMVALPWVLRKALGFIKVLEIEDTPKHFKTRLKAGGVLDVLECYPWTGEEILHSRRDKRKGVHKGCVSSTTEGPCINVSWENPFGGTCSDTFALSEDELTLTVKTKMHIRDSGRSCTYNSVYSRIHKS